MANDDQRRPPGARAHRPNPAKTQLSKISGKTQGKKRWALARDRSHSICCSEPGTSSGPLVSAEAYLSRTARVRTMSSRQNLSLPAR